MNLLKKRVEFCTTTIGHWDIECRKNPTNDIVIVTINYYTNRTEGPDWGCSGEGDTVNRAAIAATENICKIVTGMEGAYYTEEILPIMYSIGMIRKFELINWNDVTDTFVYAGRVYFVMGDLDYPDNVHIHSLHSLDNYDPTLFELVDEERDVLNKLISEEKTKAKYEAAALDEWLNSYC